MLSSVVAMTQRTATEMQEQVRCSEYSYQIPMSSILLLQHGTKPPAIEACALVASSGARGRLRKRGAAKPLS